MNHSERKTLAPLVSSEAPGVEQLDRFQWRNRVLLVFRGSDDETGLFARQVLEVEHGVKGLEERQFRVFLVERGGDSRAADALRREYQLDAAEFAVALIGKDGTLKRLETRILPMTELFATVDAMPMRRAEMK